MPKWDQLADQKTIDRTIEALKANGFEAYVVENGEEAKRKVLELVPVGAEVMNMTSMTLESINVASEIQTSSRFNSVRKKLLEMNRETQGQEMQRIGAAPEWVVARALARVFTLLLKTGIY